MKWLRKLFCKSQLKDWEIQSTKQGFNGDVLVGDSIVMISHTNASHTRSSDSTWKENRVEIHKEIDKSAFNWSFTVEFLKLPPSNDWVIFSQLWNVTHDNVLALVVKNFGDEIEIQLNQKQDKVTTGLFSQKLNRYDVVDIDLLAGKDFVTGYINNISVGDHALEVFTNAKQYIKHGLYWSGRLPFNNKSKIVAQYKNIN